MKFAAIQCRQLSKGDHEENFSITAIVFKALGATTSLALISICVEI
jgi:hypothetical protein